MKVKAIIRFYVLLMGLCAMSVMAFAQSCEHDLDCHGTWEADHCVCGVHGVCRGVTQQAPEGMCKCFGKEGSCHTPATDSSPPVRGPNPIRRGVAPRI